MGTLQLTLSQLGQIFRHLESTYPEEGCGLLVGSASSERTVVREVREAGNSWTPEMAEWLGQGADPTASRRNRFSIAPEVMFQVQKAARHRHLSIVGIYHSHPDAPAIPSEFDRSIAWPHYSYAIASVQQGKAVDIRSWKLDGNQQFQPEKILKGD